MSIFYFFNREVSGSLRNKLKYLVEKKKVNGSESKFTKLEMKFLYLKTHESPIFYE